MQKRVISIVFIIIVSLSIFVIAQDNESGEDNFDSEGITFEEDSLIGVDQAYQCLENEIDKKSEESLSLTEAIFSILALGSDTKLENVIEDNKKSGEDCWPESSCTIKETAQVLMAYDRINKNIDGIEDWLLTKEKDADELNWFIEIDIQDHEASECTLRYDSTERTIEVREDMKLEGNPGSCLSIGYGGYWLKINDNCLDEEFEISCYDDSSGTFVTTLAYQKKSSSTIFISSKTSSAPKGGTTNEKVNSKCFSPGSSEARKCDYEGTLWAAVALQKAGKEVSSYIPYLLALADSNQKHFPSTFLFFLTGGDDQYSEIVQKQKSGGFWDIIGGENRFYDTSLAMFALGGTGAGEVDSAKSYLLSVQTSDGCWNNNNIRDTGFILYSGWPKSVPTSSGGGGTPVSCESSGFYCENPFRCRDIGGNNLYNYDCSLKGAGLECCDVRVLERTCAEQEGVVCSPNQECSSATTSSADGTCCLGRCELIQENECQVNGGDCRRSCTDDEVDTGDICPDSGRVCCKQKATPDEPDGISIWVWVLGVLILLVLLGIIFRNKIRMWFWKRKGKAKVRRFSRPPSRPPGRSVMARHPQYHPTRRSPPAVRRSASSPKDKEMEETMKKLKEMSK